MLLKPPSSLLTLPYKVSILIVLEGMAPQVLLLLWPFHNLNILFLPLLINSFLSFLQDNIYFIQAHIILFLIMHTLLLLNLLFHTCIVIFRIIPNHNFQFIWVISSSSSLGLYSLSDGLSSSSSKANLFPLTFYFLFFFTTLANLVDLLSPLLQLESSKWPSSPSFGISIMTFSIIITPRSKY